MGPPADGRRQALLSATLPLMVPTMGATAAWAEVAAKPAAAPAPAPPHAPPVVKTKLYSYELPNKDYVNSPVDDNWNDLWHFDGGCGTVHESKSGNVIAVSNGPQPGFLDELLNYVSQWSLRGPPGIRVYKNTRSDTLEELIFTEMPLGNNNLVVPVGPFTDVLGGRPSRTVGNGGRGAATRYFYKTIKNGGKSATMGIWMPIKNIAEMPALMKTFDSFKVAA